MSTSREIAIAVPPLGPFAEKDYVDMTRACNILGVSWQTVMRLAQSGILEMIEYRERSWKKVRYRSIVEFCDRLRQSYSIPDRRRVLSAPYLRHRDEDLLPFPMRITMGSDEALTAMGISNRRAIPQLIEEGRFEAYRLVIGAPWRISRPSFGEYLAGARRRTQHGTYAYRSASVVGSDFGVGKSPLKTGR
jgi:hypothetical protein